MKYKLKKDLPFAKAGNKVTLEPLSWREDRKHWIVEVDKDKQTEFYFAQHIGYEDYDMSDWIEEVKPRLFFIELFKDSGKISDASFDPTILREDARFTIVKATETL